MMRTAGAFEFVMFVFLLVGCVFIGCGIGIGYGKGSMCRQWAGESATVYEGKCMVPTEGGGLRPARRDE